MKTLEQLERSERLREQKSVQSDAKWETAMDLQNELIHEQEIDNQNTIILIGIIMIGVIAAIAIIA